MKNLSSTLLIFISLLLIFVLGFVSLWTFSLLKTETRAHTFQFALLQTEVIGKPLVEQVNRIMIDSSGKAPVGVELFYKLKPAASGWKIDGEVKVDEKLESFVSKLGGTGIKLLPYSDETHVFAISKLSATEGTLSLVNASKIYQECEGQAIGVINAAGELVMSCDQTVKKSLKDTPASYLSRIKDSKFSAGSFETGDPDHLLYSYYQPNALFSVIGVTPSKVAFRSAYFLGLRMVLLILCGFGLATLLSVFLARRVTGPIELVTLATDRISKGEFDFPIQVKGRNEIKTLADSVRAMSQQIKKLIVSEVEKTKIEAQLEVAGELQKTFLPPTSVSVKGFQLESLYQPADQCGGDWWIHLELGQKLILMIGDVTGHGYPSALLVAATRGGIANLEASLEKSDMSQITPSQILTMLNRVVFDSTQGSLAMTALCMIIDRESGQYTLSSAAHQPSYLLQQTPAAVKSLPLAGFRLGEKRDLDEPFAELTGILLPFERLVLSTDGLQDLGPEDKLLNKKGVLKFLKEHIALTSREIVERVATELIPLNDGIPLRDDVTFVIVERTAFDAAEVEAMPESSTEPPSGPPAFKPGAEGLGNA